MYIVYMASRPPRQNAKNDARQQLWMQAPANKRRVNKALISRDVRVQRESRQRTGASLFKIK